MMRLWILQCLLADFQLAGQSQRVGGHFCPARGCVHVLSGHGFLSHAARLPKNIAIATALCSMFISFCKFWRTLVRGALHEIFIRPTGEARNSKLRTQNDVLLIKSLHKVFNKCNLPWVKLNWESYYSNGKLPSTSKFGSFWWRNITKLINQYKGIAQAQVESGTSVMFWEDHWNSAILKNCFPELFSFSKKQFITLHQVKNSNLPDLFFQPLSEQTFDQFH
jgi:hypothetical protein